MKADIKITNSEWAQIKEDLATCKTCSNELDRTLLELTECRDEVVSHQYKEWWQSEYAILGIALSSFFLGVTVTSLSK